MGNSNLKGFQLDEESSDNVLFGQKIWSIKLGLASNMRRTMTLSETILWSRLRRSALGYKFRRQQVIDGFIADFYCSSARLVIELDGKMHDKLYDKERDEILSVRGLKVLRFENSEVESNVGAVVSRIKDYLPKT